MAIYGRLWQLKEPLPCQYILIIRQLQNSMAIWQFLKDRHNYNITDRKVLILFNIPSVAKTKRVRHCLMTHPSYYNLVYSLAGYSLLILTSFISPQNNCPLPSCNPSHGTCCSALGLCFLLQTSPWCQPHLPRTAGGCRFPYQEQCFPHQGHRCR